MLAVYCPYFYYYWSKRIPTTEWFPRELTVIPKKTGNVPMIIWLPVANCWGYFFLEIVNNYELENVIVIAFNSNDVY